MNPALVIDAHVHFWDPAALRYPWLESVPALERAFLPPDYFLDGAAAPDAVVFVEGNCTPAESAAEVRFVRRLANVEPRIAGIVAFVDLLDERTRTVALQRVAATREVVGVRHNIQGHPPGFCVRAAFVRGVEEVGQCDLPFDLCATADQLQDVEDLVSQCPGTEFVLDHCGKPSIRDEAFAPWSEDLARLAMHPNVSCKLSGLLTEAHADQRDEMTLLPYARHAYSCFGASRLLFGSDWPVLTIAGNTAQWRTFTDRFTAAWTPDHRHLFYAGNAIRIYGLDVHGHS